MAIAILGTATGVIGLFFKDGPSPSPSVRIDLAGSRFNPTGRDRPSDENSVNTLEQAEVSPSNLSTIATDVQKVGTSSKELVAAVKTEFAPQINSMKGSVAAVEATLRELTSAPSSSTLSHAVTAIPAQVEALKRSAGEIQDVTKSKCK